MVNADIAQQQKSAEKHNKASKIAAGVGTAAAAYAVGRTVKTNKYNKHLSERIQEMKSLMGEEGGLTAEQNKGINAVAKIMGSLKKDPNDTGTKVAATAAAGSYAIAAYEKVRAVTAKHWTNEKTHEKAVRKAQEQYDKMKKTFVNTPYMSLFKEQIAAYKKEHPNTQLTDRQIAQNLMA
jgi:hypothetical protein